MMPKSSSTSDIPNPSIQKDSKTKIADESYPLNHDGVGGTIAEILDSDYRGISPYQVAMFILVVAILWTGIKTVQQIQNYHHMYEQMTKLKKEFRQLQIERQRMLIEQQTFSGTPQVTNRAVSQLNMFYPNLSDRMIIHANNTVTYPSQEDVVTLVNPKKTTHDTANSATTSPSQDSKTIKKPIDSTSKHQ